MKHFIEYATQQILISLCFVHTLRNQNAIRDKGNLCTSMQIDDNEIVNSNRKKKLAKRFNPMEWHSFNTANAFVRV